MCYYSSLLLIFLLSFYNISLHSQSLIVGIPSADVAEKGHIEFTHESQVNTWSTPKSWNSFNFLCFGIGKSTELTATFNNLNNQGSENMSAGLGAKHVFKLSKENKYESKLTIGGNLLYSLNRKDVGFWTYSHFSFRLPKTKTRLTAGLSYGTEQSFGFRKVLLQESNFSLEPQRPFSLMVGFEQPLSKHVSLVADWFSGDHDLAALISGVQIDIGHHVLIFGYKMPNDFNRAGQAVVLEFMISLPTKRH